MIARLGVGMIDGRGHGRKHHRGVLQPPGRQTQFLIKRARRTEAISPSSLGKGVVTSESRKEEVNPVRADELRSNENIAQLSMVQLLSSPSFS
jgi:hypothetical protein